MRLTNMNWLLSCMILLCTFTFIQTANNTELSPQCHDLPEDIEEYFLNITSSESNYSKWIKPEGKVYSLYFEFALSSYVGPNRLCQCKCQHANQSFCILQ